MSISKETTLDEFREAMQHRVVKYPLNSRPVKEALRFAKKHKDPAYYRVASDKIHAQRQFQRELYGPGRLERLIDFVSLGSLKEVVVTLLLVVLGVVGIDSARRFMQEDPDSDLYANMDVDELATRLGIALEAGGSAASGSTPAANSSTSSSTGHLDETNSLVEPRAGENPSAVVRPPSSGTTQLSDADVDRIADAVIQRMAKQPLEAASTPRSVEDQPTAVAATTVDSPVVDDADAGATLAGDTLAGDSLGSDTLESDTLGSDTLGSDTLESDSLESDSLATDSLASAPGVVPADSNPVPQEN